MINTNLLNPNQNLNNKKEDIKNDAKKTKTQTSNNLLSNELKKNLGLNTLIDKPNIQNPNLIDNTQLKLQNLINKLLDQLKAHKNPDSNILKQAPNLNFAPNFSKELKSLSIELAKDEHFKPLLEKLNQISKPINQIQKNDVELLFKNSGVFFEAKLKNALNTENFPKSFHSLLNTIKTLSSNQIASQIAELASKNQDLTSSFKNLKTILQTNKEQNLNILKNSSFQTLLSLSGKIENFKKYLTKNPSLANKKIHLLGNKILNELKKHENTLYKELNKPQNLILSDTKIIKEISQNFKHLKDTLKNILNHKQDNAQNSYASTPHQEKPSDAKNPIQNTHNKNTILQDANFIKQENLKEESKVLSNSSDTKILENESNKTQNGILKEEKRNNENSQKNEIPEDEKQLDLENSDTKINEKTQDATKLDLKKENQTLNSKKENSEKISQELLKKENEIKNPSTPNPEKATQSNSTFFESKNKDGIVKENANFQNQNSTNAKISIKNLIFNDEKNSMGELEKLNKDLSALSRKINEGLKILDNDARNAKINLNDIKNIDNKLELSIKDLSKVTIRNNAEISDEIQNDIKSTLFQVSNLAKNLENDAVLNQANRLLAQIEINQLLSLANNSINTFLPFFWEDLNDSKIIFKRGKKDKFFAQIKLEFAKLGELDVLVALNNDKYIDINIMVENTEFRKIIYQNAHELKRSISKIGLLGSHFFVGDIIRTEFKNQKLKDYDLDIGIDKKA
ncbi:flagellar hook-length control protein FliK [Campylobacter sp. CCS1377]|uniref:Flagellar hook-length control protein FliK n=1 Tax=Campylobacter sp. CCS1377 TaxID=3158229 RepID=A0AAU7E4T7_9BACT